MGSLNGFLWLCFWVYFFIYRAIDVENVEGAGNVEGTVFIDGRVAIGSTDEDFICATLDWWPPEKCDYGTCSWGLASLLNLDLNNTILLNAIKAFSPLKLRLGGTLQDKVIYDIGYPRQPCKQFVKNSSDSELFGFTQGCLPMYRWDELNNFFKKSGAVIIFGLNALNGRTIKPDNSAVGPWDFKNAASLIRYTVNKNYTIHGWELGNELSGSGVGTRVTAAQYASDVIALYSIVHDIYKDSKVKPLVIAPGGFFDANWYKELIDKTPNSMNAVTHHIYNLGPGVDQHLVEKILDPHYLDGEANTFSSLKSILKSSATSATAWVGEAGGAYNSGHNLVTNAFVFSFWYLDQLGMAASYDTKTYCRQTLIGGNYGLLNTTTFLPNPDYYSALLWHRLMGRTVLQTNFSGTNKIRAYSHCSKQSQGITLLLINLDGNTTAEVPVENVEGGENVEGTVYIDGRVAIGSTDEDFICATLDWWPPEKCDYGTCSWGLASLLNLVSFFLCTFVIDFSFGFWYKMLFGLLSLFRAVIIFGLNALNGRTIMPDHSAVGPWDFKNAASLIRYTVNKNYTIHGWELGNELSGSGVGTRITAAQYASDVIALNYIVQDIYKDSKVKPLVIAPGGFFDANWYKELIDKTPNSMNVVTHHIYNLGPGVDQHLVEKILDPHYLDGEANTFSSLKSILNSSATSATAWVGEAGGAYNSGHNLVTNAFVFSFWYLDQLGMAASYDAKTYCRQTLIGGNYGLLNTTTFIPNPDYYSALLWHRLMGTTVLRTNFSGTKKVRAYSHCSKQSQGITLLLINLDGNTTAEVRITTKTTASKRTQTLKSQHGSSGSRIQYSKTAEIIREEYHLTAKDGDLHGQTMLLNGKILAVNSSGEIPPLEPIFVNSTEPINVAPYSIVFAHIPMIDLPACR
ncbi:Glycoside hydrolase [Macleaya cordata]|uniref:Glycoside hydrolase n=1 Tax=Macleaya cordata TaxID=56857 RepID=A0A200R962_MACCD|nr:Glycoside hydrolase [Macleaya cordata]